MSWEQLISIRREAAELRRQEADAPPVACEDDGEPLELVRGCLHCPFCGRSYST